MVSSCNSVCAISISMLLIAILKMREKHKFGCSMTISLKDITEQHYLVVIMKNWNNSGAACFFCEIF